MKKLASVSLLAMALLLVAAAPSQARPGFHHSHFARGRVFVGVGVGPAWWGPPYWYYPPPYYVYSPPPPVLIQQQPPVYVQQPAAPVQAAPEAYWYYCSSASAYYPNVQSCPEPWVKVAPQPQ